MLRLVFISHGSTGDIVPVIRLAEEAARRGHRATVFASHHWRSAIESRGIRFVAIPPHGPQEELSSLMERYSSIRNPLRLVEAMHRHVDEWQEEILPALTQALRDADALLYSYLFPLYERSARALGIPAISVHFCPNTYFSPLHPPDNLPQLPRFVPESLQRSWNVRFTTFADRYVTHRINRQISRSSQRIPAWLRSPADYSLILAPPELHRGTADELPCRIHFSGFVSGGFSSHPATAAAAATIERAPLLNFGSVTNDSMKGEFRSLYHHWPADQPLTIQRGWFPPPAPPPEKQIRIIPPGPHEKLFPQAAVIIHHGGAGTTTSALLAGTPQVIIPHFADQKYWARTVENLGCGSSLRQRGWGRNLWDAVRPLLQREETQQNARTFATRQASRSGAQQAIDRLEDWLKDHQPQPQPALTI
ncbi:MAG: glycosyltransferase [Puniceicoccales bacterium]